MRDMAQKTKGILLDADYFINEKEEATIRLFLHTEKGLEVFAEKNYSPYFYVIVDDAEKRLKELEQMRFGDKKFSPKKVTIEKKGNAKNALKIFFKNTFELKIARDEVKNNQFVLEKREYDIPFTKRYLIDKGLEPMNGLEITHSPQNEIEGLKVFEADDKMLSGIKAVSFDFETHSPGRFSNASKDPVISVAVAGKKEQAFFAWQKEGKKTTSRLLENEKEVLTAFLEKLEKEKPSILVTYNGDNFDLPYLKERAKKLRLDLGKVFVQGEIRLKRMGLDNAAALLGMQHVDAYKVVRILNRFGVVSLVKFDLESVSEALFGKPKEKVDHRDINTAFETGEGMQRMIDYNIEDAKVTLHIAEEYLPLYFEISKLTHQPLFESTRNAASSLVEDLLMVKAAQQNVLIPNRPEEGEVKRRTMQSFQGGYVKEPVAGLHENIAVLDFRSLHPSIMIAHNVSPETLKCAHPQCMSGKNVSPDKDWFCEKEKGFIPMVVEEILAKRIEAKNAMKKLNPAEEGYRFLKAKQQALKIVLNSHYGYLGYPRSRWYSRESAKAVTSWSRHYIRDINSKAELAGFTALYSDTDSAFLKLPNGKTKDDVLEFIKKINTDLPESMELDFEGYYKRGIFVTKRDGGAAKKRYALLDFNNKLKIVGFEYVRRDWAKIAKDTQRDVIQAVLEEGSPTKAIEIVRKVIKKLRDGKVEKKDLIVLTQIKKPIKKYESIGPHVAAAMKAIRRGKKIEVGTTIEFIITKNGKSISDKAELEEYVKEGNYDADYYIEHQVVPAVTKIISELGVSQQDLIHGGKQQSLGHFS